MKYNIAQCSVFHCVTQHGVTQTAPFWCGLTQDVLEKRPLNGCSE